MCYIKFFFFKITILLMSTGHNLKKKRLSKKAKKNPKKTKKTTQIIQATPTSLVSKQTVKKACSHFKQSVP